MRCTTLPVAAAAAVALVAAPALAQEHDHSIVEIGRTADNTLVFHTHATLPLPMPESTIPGFPGYTMVELAFESLAAPNAHGQLPIDPASDIHLILVGIDPGLTLYNGITPMVPGGDLPVGHPFFHFMPLWQIQPVPLGVTFTASVRAHDSAGLYTDSAPFQISFVTAPAPGAAAGLLVGAGVLGLRRRR